MNIREIFPVIDVNMETKKAVLNQKAKEEFELSLDELQIKLKNIDFNKKIDFIYIGNYLYAINIVKGIKNMVLCFSKIEDTNLSFSTFKTETGFDIDIYPKEILKEFLEKFLAIKRRYGTFNIKFLYFTLTFTKDIAPKLKRDFLNKILKYTVAITRSSDVVGQITEYSFGIILTNVSNDGANVVADKIIRYISELNVENEYRLIEVYGALAHELFIMKNLDFDKLIEKLYEKSQFITLGLKLEDIVQ